MEYKIIRLSESFASYKDRIGDKEWIGEIPSLVYGWQFEYRNAAGEYEYGSVGYQHMMPKDYANMWHTDDGSEWIHEIPRWNGWEPTGRVVFRGYATEYYDPDEREWFVKDYDITDEMDYIVGYDE